MTGPDAPGTRASAPEVWALAALLLFLSVANATWTRLGGGPLHWDSAIHLIESLQAHRAGEELARPHWKQLLYASSYYPPFVSYVSAPFYAVLGESLFTALLVMNTFALLLAVATWGIVRRLFGRGAALTAALLISACPITIEYSRNFMLDLPLAAMVALSMWLVLASDGLRRTGTSLLAGASLGCGLLTRWTFVFFLAAPIAWCLVRAFRPGGGRGVRVRNLLAALAVGAVLAAPWYTVRIIQVLTTHGGELGRGGRPPWQALTYYLAVVPEQASWLITLVLLAGVALHFRYARRPHAALVTWFLGSYAVLSLVGYKQPRFSLPLLAPLVLVAAAGWTAWRDRVPASRRRRSLVLRATMALVVAQYLVISFAPASSGVGRLLARPLLGTSWIAARGPGGADWRQEDLLRRVAADAKRAGKRRVGLCVIPDHIHFNRQTFEFFAVLHRAPIAVAGVAGFPLFADYVVAKTGDPGGSTTRQRELARSVMDDSRKPDPLYTEIDRLPLPDGSAAVLFRVTPRRAAGASEPAVRAQVLRQAERFFRRFVRPVGEYSLSVGAGDYLETARGHVPSLRLRVKRAWLGDFAFDRRGVLASDLDLELSGVVLDPVALLEEDSLEVLSVGGLRVRSVTVAARDLREYVEVSSGGRIAVDELSLEDGALRLRAHRAGPVGRLCASVRLWSVGQRNIAFRFLEFRVASIPIHPAIVNAMTDAYSPLLTGFGALSEFRIGDLELSGGELALRDHAAARR